MRMLDVDGTLIPQPPAPSRGAWFALFGAPAAWALQGVIVWLVEARACHSTLASGDALPAGVRASGIGLAIVAGAVAVAALLTGVDGARHGRGLLDVRTRPDFLAVAGVLVSAAFLIAILLTGYASAMLDLCRGMR